MDSEYYKYKKYKKYKNKYINISQISGGISDRESKKYLTEVLVKKHHIPIRDLGILTTVPDTEIAYHNFSETMSQRSFIIFLNNILKYIPNNIDDILFLLIGFKLNVNSKIYNKDGTINSWDWASNVEKHAIVINLVKLDGLNYRLECFDSNGSMDPDNYYFDKTIYFLLRGLSIELMKRDNIDFVEYLEIRSNLPSLHALTTGGGDCDALAIFYIYLRYHYSLEEVSEFFATFEGDDRTNKKNISIQRKIIRYINNTIKKRLSFEKVVELILDDFKENTQKKPSRNLNIGLPIGASVTRFKKVKKLKKPKRLTGPKSWKIKYGLVIK